MQKPSPPSFKIPAINSGGVATAQCLLDKIYYLEIQLIRNYHPFGLGAPRAAPLRLRQAANWGKIIRAKKIARHKLPRDNRE
jgi:hypothetical protein